MKSPEQVAREGAIFNLNDGAVFYENGAFMRFIIWPGSGCRMLGGHLAMHFPGKVFDPHIHPISEDCICVVKGLGQGFLIDKWVDVGPGDLIYAPAGLLHGTANRPGHDADFLCHGYAGPPQFDLYQWAGYFKNGKFDWDAIKEGMKIPDKRDVEIGDDIRLGEIPTFGGERAESKTPQQIRETGAIFNINGGIEYTGFGPLTRFVVAPFMGSQLISATVVVHKPGETFKPRSYLASYDANLVIKGKGQAYLGGNWTDVKAGDISYAPPTVEHGTRNPAENTEPLVTVMFASPPPFELYSEAGILRDGKFSME
jgi:quercetin dioxygenase-like cupin family protein